METVAGAVSNSITGLGVPVAYPSIATYPYNCVVLIETAYPAGQAYFGSGVVIGPHTILTASHLLWDSTTASEANQVWLYPAYNQSGIPNPPGSLGPLSATLAWHNYPVGNPDGRINQSQGYLDFAVIDTDYTFTSWMNPLLDYGGGNVHVTGYPRTANGIQDDHTGNVIKDPGYPLLDYPNGFVSPGNSGGPLWLEGFNYVVGIVSTTGWAVQLTAVQWNAIVAWENADSYLWAPPPPPPVVNPVIPVAASGDFNSNGNSDFVWTNSSGVTSMWEYDPQAQTVSTTSLGPNPGWTILSSAHFSNAGTSQMLMDYVPNGTMTLWWVNSGALTGIPLGQSWINVGYLAAGQFLGTNGAAGINDFLVTNVVDHHLYDWWITPQNQLAGFELTATSGVSWANVGLVASGQFTNNGGTNFLVNNTVDHHLYDWWIDGNGALQGIDLGAYWSNVALVGAGQFTTNGGTNFLVSNNIDHHLYDWWIDANNTLQGIDLGAAWANVQLVTAGRFDNNTSNIEMLVQNTIDHHLYEWWITPSGQLTGVDLGAYWANVQLIGSSHYNNNSAFNELLVRNTVDNHFYEWWIAGNQLQGVDLGAVPTSATVANTSIAAVTGSSTTVASSGHSAAGTTPPAVGAGTLSGNEVSSAGLSATSPGTDGGLQSPDSTALLAQAMASFGSSDAVVNSTGGLIGAGPLPQSDIVTPIDPRLAHP